MNKLWLVGTMLLLLIGSASANGLQIEQVLFDPIKSEAGGEFVRIHNTGTKAVNLSGYTLKTETSVKDATLPSVVLEAEKYFLVTDLDWDSQKDNIAWPNADYKEEVTLKATSDGIALIYNNTVIDAIGWGNISEINLGLYEGTPFSYNFTEGFSLQRQQDTENNSADFILAKPTFKEKVSGKELFIGFFVTNHAPKIINITLTDDLDEDGIQILPNPGALKEVSIEVVTEDLDNDTLETYVIVDGGKFVLTDGKGSFLINYTTLPGNYTIEAYTKDPNNETANLNITFEYEELIALDLDASNIGLGEVNKNSEVIIEGDLDFSTADKPTVKNNGNVALDIGLVGSDFIDGDNTLSITSLKYNLGEIQGTLSDAIQVGNTGLAGGNVIDLGFNLNLPNDLTKGNYKGSVVVVGVAA